MGAQPVVLTDEQWMLRLTSAVSRGQRYGFDDWTADRNILDEFADRYGLWGECVMCPPDQRQHFVKVTEIAGYDEPVTLCTNHREPIFPARKINVGGGLVDEAGAAA